VYIDLSRIREHVDQEDSAVTILNDLLTHYKGFEVVAMLGFSPDTGMDVYTTSLRMYIELIHLGKLGDDDVVIDKGIEITKADLIVELYDGHELAVAFLKLKGA